MPSAWLTRLPLKQMCCSSRRPYWVACLSPENRKLIQQFTHKRLERCWIQHDFGQVLKITRATWRAQYQTLFIKSYEGSPPVSSFYLDYFSEQTLVSTDLDVCDTKLLTGPLFSSDRTQKAHICFPGNTTSLMMGMSVSLATLASCLYVFLPREGRCLVPLLGLTLFCSSNVTVLHVPFRVWGWWWEGHGVGVKFWTHFGHLITNWT